MNALKAISFYVVVVALGLIAARITGADNSATAVSGFICAAWAGCMILVHKYDS